MHYRYKAINPKNGKHQRGKIEVEDREEALLSLKKEGLYVMELKEIRASFWSKDLNIWIGSPVKHQEFVVFCRQLAILLQSGTTLVDSIQLLAGQAESKPFREALQDIYQEVRSGNPLSEACQKHPKIFNQVFVHMVMAGETSGQLDEVMKSLATYFEKEHRLREKIKSALMYPIILALTAIVVVSFLLINVIPKFVQSLTSAGGSIPLPTALVLKVSQLLGAYWLLLLFVIAGLGLGLYYLKRRERGSYYFDYLKLKLPIVGVLIQKSAIVRMTRTLSTLFSSAVPVLQSLGMVAEIVNNEVMAKVLRQSRQSLRSGESLSEPLKQSWVFPPLVAHMIQSGEESGQLDHMLENIADFYEEDVEQMVSRLSAIIEPLLILVLGVVVGTIVLAALLPMFEIYRNVG